MPNNYANNNAAANTSSRPYQDINNSTISCRLFADARVVTFNRDGQERKFLSFDASHATGRAVNGENEIVTVNATINGTAPYLEQAAKRLTQGTSVILIGQMYPERNEYTGKDGQQHVTARLRFRVDTFRVIGKPAAAPAAQTAPASAAPAPTPAPKQAPAPAAPKAAPVYQAPAPQPKAAPVQQAMPAPEEYSYNGENPFGGGDMSDPFAADIPSFAVQ